MAGIQYKKCIRQEVYKMAVMQYEKLPSVVKCGAYLRISREEWGKEESNSLTNQRKLITQFVKKQQNFELCREWVDDGVSGSHFDREGLRKMLCSVAKREITCIIVKDLSRFGREYIETGYYLQEFFPKHDIRFIAVCDGYDSASAHFMEQNLLMPILNILNDSYCQDISQKVRIQQEIKRQEGAYIGAFCVYGYKKDTDDHNHLVIDQAAAGVVRSIFEMKASGMSAERISAWLNEKGVLSPYEYKKEKNSRFVSGFVKEKTCLWHPNAVRRILKDEVYIGSIVQGKRKKISYKLSIRENVPSRQWVRVAHMHEPIVSDALFKKAQQSIGRKRQ